jgi:tetratricopeptide (TPR) repeat protein
VVLGVFSVVAWIPTALAQRNPRLALAVNPTDSDALEDLAYAEPEDPDFYWAGAQSLSPFNAIYPWRRAQIAANLGHWPEAEAFSRKAIELEPHFLRARALLAKVLSHQGRRFEADRQVQELERLRAQGPTGAAENNYERAVSGFDPADL